MSSLQAMALWLLEDVYKKVNILGIEVLRSSLQATARWLFLLPLILDAHSLH